ncbi:hypothetical protein JHD48_08260 [Sulfurimonas sp. SAG-AH-194-I05]|nr:hypothetical protein [Sulfurimonas sp. SAG-AH-194-I05]MDF1875726.1 hypothetical protein [Sulfurimonas sp. SAG-AH-194-I05]
MYKIIVLFPLLMSGCSHFVINGMMCDRLVKDPFAPFPAECRNYVDSEAEKAFTLEKKIVLPQDQLEVLKEKK